MWKLLRGRAGPRSRAAALDSDTDHSPPNNPPQPFTRRARLRPLSGRAARAAASGTQARGARRAATQRRVRAQRAVQRAQRAASLARHPQHTWRFSRGSADGAPSVEHHYPRPPVASALVAVRGVARRRARQSAGSEQRCGRGKRMRCMQRDGGQQRRRVLIQLHACTRLIERYGTPPLLLPWPPSLQRGVAVHS